MAQSRLLTLMFLLVAIGTTIQPVTAATAGAGTHLVLEVVINGRSTGMVGNFIVSDGELLAQRSELKDIGFQLSSNSVSDDLVVLSTQPGFLWRLDQATQTIYFSADDSHLQPALVKASEDPNSRIPVESSTGLTLNYDAAVAHVDSQYSLNGNFDLRAFSPYGVLSSGVLVYQTPNLGFDAGEYRTIRLDTTYNLSDPDSTLRYRAGDFIIDGLSWTRPVRFGGVEIKSDFSLRPDMVTMPLPSFSGSVAVPSTVDVLVNGDRAISQELQQGPFEIPQLPIVSGANNVSVTLTNSLGQQVLENLPLYGAAGLLAPGLQSFSGEVGAVRLNWGYQSNDYGNMAFAGTWRRGLSPDFTIEMHAESTSRLISFAVGGGVNLDNLAILNVGLAGSGGPHNNGAEISAGISRLGQYLSFNAAVISKLQHFSDIAAVNGDPVPTLQINTSVSVTLKEFGVAGLAYTSIDGPSAPPVETNLTTLSQTGITYSQPVLDAHILSASYSKQIGAVSIYATGFHDFAKGQDNGVLIGLTLPIGGGSSASATAGAGAGGRYGELEANKPAVELDDWGYQVYGSSGVSPHEFGEVHYQARWGTVYAGADYDAKQLELRLEAQGSLTYLDGGLFLSNSIDDSFAVVDTNGVADVGVLDEHREIGKTDSDGRLLLPNLRSYDVNHLEIDPNDVSPDLSISSTAREVRPAERSGIVVSFLIRDNKSALLRLLDSNGNPVPLGSTAELTSTRAKYPVGIDGEVYLEDLQPQNHVAVTEPTGKYCAVDFGYQSKSGDIPAIGPLQCQ